MVLITDERDGGGARVKQLQLQQHQQQKVGGNVALIHPTIAEEPPSNSDDEDYPSSSEDEDYDEDEDEFEEVDFEDLDDGRSIASDDSFYPPDDVFADSERTPSPDSPEPLSLFQACCTNNAAIVRIMIRHGVREEQVKETDRNNRRGSNLKRFNKQTEVSEGAPATSVAPTGFSLALNKPTASATPFSLSAATSSSAPAGAGLTFGSVLTSMAPQQPAATAFTLGLGAATTTTTAALSGPSLGGGLFSNTMSTGLGQTALGGGSLTLGSLLATSTAVSVAPAPSLGLGGVDFSTSSENKSDSSSGANAQDSKALKDENLPPVICQDVDNFQKFVKEQKQVQEDISRMSSKAISKVQDDIKSLKQLLSVNASGLQRQALAIDKLKLETAQELKNADIALRTQKTPPGLQHENTAPSDYFRSLVEQFEVQLQQYRQQIEELENHLTTQSSGSHITPQDLTLAMQKLYQTFVAQAAQLQSVHENVKILKHQYLSFRRAFLEDSTDIFESKRASNRKWQSTPRVTTGPAPFSSVPNAAAVAMAATLTQQQQPAPGTQAPLGAGFGNPFASAVGTSLGSSTLGGFGGGPGFGGVGTGGSSFAFSSTSKPTGGSLSAGFGSSSTSGFNFSNPGLNPSAGLTFGVSNPPAAGFGTGGPLLQLKKPPAGNKRGKR